MVNCTAAVKLADRSHSEVASGVTAISFHGSRPVIGFPQFADDPLCVERPVDEAECCALVHCAGTTECQCGPHAECKQVTLQATGNMTFESISLDGIFF